IAADVDAHVMNRRGIVHVVGEEDQVTGAQLTARHMRARIPLVGRDAWDLHADARVRSLSQAGTVELTMLCDGAGTAPQVRGTEPVVCEGDRADRDVARRHGAGRGTEGLLQNPDI